MALSTGSKVFLAILALGGVLVGAALVFLGQSSAPAVEEGTPVTVTIPQGVGAGHVAELLAEQGVIRSPFAFRVSARLDGRGSQIKAGTYELTAGMSADEILAILTAGPPAPPTFRVTIPEGLTVAQTLERIAQAESSPFTVEQLRAALDGVPLPAWVPVDQLPEGAEPFEGILFPNTYEFTTDADPQDVLARLVAETDSVLSEVTPPPDMTPYEVLVAASLVEREARLREEQPLVASVISNRLREGMRLQIDATVLYALGEHKERVLKRDLEVDSPWNTYVVTGLPPTPISGAGEGAIRAAAAPASTDFLYYVVCEPDTGRHAFTRTLDEHNRAKAGDECPTPG